MAPGAPLATPLKERQKEREREEREAWLKEDNTINRAAPIHKIISFTGDSSR